MYFFYFGMGSLVAIGLGLFARDALGKDIANVLLFGGVIVGCLNVLAAPFMKKDD